MDAPDAPPQPTESSTPPPASPTDPAEPPPIPQASAIEKLPPRPAPTCGYIWSEWSPNASVIYLRNSEDANRHLSTMTPGCVGFDLEWKPVFARGAKENPVALVQLANDDRIYLLQVTAMKEFPSKLQEILEDPAYIKAGVGIQGDTKKLFTDWGVSVRSCVDLSLLARTVDNARWKGKYNSPIGLARLVEVYCYRLLDKGRITRSNWESVLKPAQQLYASNDAHAGFTVYKHLMSMAHPTDPPPSKYYTFDCVRSYYCGPLGLPWSPENPNYDPGPSPPPRPPKERSKDRSPDESSINQPEAQYNPPEHELEQQSDPMASVQRHESVLKIARSTWLRQQGAELGNNTSSHNQPNGTQQPSGSNRGQGHHRGRKRSFNPHHRPQNWKTNTGGQAGATSSLPNGSQFPINGDGGSNFAQPSGSASWGRPYQWNQRPRANPVASNSAPVTQEQVLDTGVPLQSDTKRRHRPRRRKPPIQPTPL